jgi:hypothetical protein
MKQRLLLALRCSIGDNIYTDCQPDSSLEASDKYTARDITDALVKKAKDGDTAAVALILQIAEYEPKEQ